jgi:hypothetical protein
MITGVSKKPFKTGFYRASQRQALLENPVILHQLCLVSDKET